MCGHLRLRRSDGTGRDLLIEPGANQASERPFSFMVIQDGPIDVVDQPDHATDRNQTDRADLFNHLLDHLDNTD